MKNKLSIKKLTSNVFGSLTDLLLWNIYLVGASVGKSGPRGVYRAFREADEILERVNHQTFASIWYQLKKKQLITYQKRSNLYNPIISEFGRKRLVESLPIYHEKRPWDRKIYIISYDIYETAHQKRNKLRKYLQNLGCKKLQESVWLTPYNIRELLNEYIKKYNIPGTIIVSDVGRDGGVGETSIIDLITKLYNIENLNDKYEQFIRKAKSQTKFIKYLLFEYLSILKEDPQLPFELLHSKYLGTKAFLIFENLQNNYIQLLIRPGK